MFPTYLVNLQFVKRIHEVVSSMKVRIIKHTTSPWKSQLVVKDIVYMLVFISTISSYWGVAKVLGVDKHNICKALKRKVQQDNANDVFLDFTQKGKCVDSLPQPMKKLVLQFWTSQTTISLHCKDVVKRYIGAKFYEATWNSLPISLTSKFQVHWNLCKLTNKTWCHYLFCVLGIWLWRACLSCSLICMCF